MVSDPLQTQSQYGSIHKALLITTVVVHVQNGVNFCLALQVGASTFLNMASAQAAALQHVDRQCHNSTSAHLHIVSRLKVRCSSALPICTSHSLG